MEVNLDGHPATLVASHPGNVSAVRTGIYSRTGRVLAPRAREIADEIMASPYAQDFDALGADEVGSLVALLEAIDADLADRGLTGRSGDVRGIVKLKLQASRRLQEWLAAYALTPRARAEFLDTFLAGRGLVADMNRRRECA